nr:HAMP domain-containing histidine kinase [Rhodoferax sp.]
MTPGGKRDQKLPAIRTRLANALAAWSLVWGLAVGTAVWAAASHEVNELLDDALQSSGELFAVLAEPPRNASATSDVIGANSGFGEQRFAWQVLAADGTLQLRSARAPTQAWHATPTPGFSDVRDWRLYGLALAQGGRMLYVAQTRDERREAQSEVALDAVLAALAVGLLGHVWLRSRVSAEMRPLQTLSQRLQDWDMDAGGALETGALGPAQRRELQPVHHALEVMTQRLALRMANERAFSAHAAHALRTPLAGIDGQMAFILRDCPSPWRERIQRSREAAQRLQGVVAALLGLFRSGLQAEPVPVDLPQLLQRLPTPRLRVDVAPGLTVMADADLLAAALLNLLDNAQRYGAQQVWIEASEPGGLRIRDDGPGVPDGRRAALQAAIDAQQYDGSTGLGLMLADRVARLHGGKLTLGAGGGGFCVDLQ